MIFLSTFIRKLLFTSAPEKQEYATKLSLIGIFLSIFVAFVSRQPLARKRRGEDGFERFDLALLGLATFRLGRLASFEQVTEPLRKPFTETVPDETGAGETVQPRGSGARRALGELISCPICSGTWIAALLVYALHTMPGPTRIFLRIMSSIGIAEILNDLTESLSWSAQAARKRAGGNS